MRWACSPHGSLQSEVLTEAWLAPPSGRPREPQTDRLQAAQPYIPNGRQVLTAQGCINPVSYFQDSGALVSEALLTLERLPPTPGSPVPRESRQLATQHAV